MNKKLTTIIASFGILGLTSPVLGSTNYKLNEDIGYKAERNAYEVQLAHELKNSLGDIPHFHPTPTPTVPGFPVPKKTPIPIPKKTPIPIQKTPEQKRLEQYQKQLNNLKSGSGTAVPVQ